VPFHAPNLLAAGRLRRTSLEFFFFQIRHYAPGDLTHYFAQRIICLSWQELLDENFFAAEDAAMFSLSAFPKERVPVFGARK
jgi:hypothetical protein